jgi:ATP-dependent DNA helicase RecG
LVIAHAEYPDSETLAVALIQELARQGNSEEAQRVFAKFIANPGHLGGARAIMAMANALLDAGHVKEAARVLDRLPGLLSASAAFDAAIAERRAQRPERAHRYFERAGDQVYNDVRALHEFAQTKIVLAGRQHSGGQRAGPFQRDTRSRLLRDAREMLERVLQMDAAPTRHAWAWFDLGRILNWTQGPRSDVEQAFGNAIALQPNETRFRTELERIRGSN